MEPTLYESKCAVGEDDASKRAVDVSIQHCTVGASWRATSRQSLSKQCKLNALNDAVMRLSFAQPDLLVVLAALLAKLLSGSWHLWRRLHGCVARPERLTKPSYA